MGHDWISLNGVLTCLEAARVSVRDRAFRLGDGVFETIRVAEGKPVRWHAHGERLLKGLEALALPFDPSPLQRWCGALITACDAPEGVLRIAVSRGEGGSGYLPPGASECRPFCAVEYLPLPQTPESATLHLSRWRKIPPECLPSHAKTAQGLNSTLARAEARENGCFEALMLNLAGGLCEAASANLFWVKQGVLHTPALAQGPLPGTARAAAIALSPLPVREGEYALEALGEAEEVFLTNALWLALPVEALQPMGWRWRSGPVARLLRGALLSSPHI